LVLCDIIVYFVSRKMAIDKEDITFKYLDMLTSSRKEAKGEHHVELVRRDAPPWAVKASFLDHGHHTMIDY
jgi:hypothetical protein